MKSQTLIAEPQTQRHRLSRFMVAYVAFFVLLAGCGYYASRHYYAASFHGASLFRNGFATDMAYYDLPRMTVSVGSGIGVDKTAAPRVRIDVSLEIPAKDLAVVEGYQPRMMDRMYAYLSALPPGRLQHVEALDSLREEMLKQVNSVGSPVPVHDLVFRALVVM